MEQNDLQTRENNQTEENYTNLLHVLPILRWQTRPRGGLTAPRLQPRQSFQVRAMSASSTMRQICRQPKDRPL